MNSIVFRILAWNFIFIAFTSIFSTIWLTRYSNYYYRLFIDMFFVKRIEVKIKMADRPNWSS